MHKPAISAKSVTTIKIRIYIHYYQFQLMEAIQNNI